MVPLLLLFFVALFYGDYFLFERGYQMYGRLLGEAFSGLFLLIVVAQLAMRRNFDLPPKYIFWFAAFVFIITAGIIANQVPTGAVVMGIRENFKYAPLFLLPIVYRFRTEQIKALTIALLFFGCIQLPFMVDQRLNEVWLTGDYITGTLLSSNNVSVFLICSWAVLFAFYLRKRINLPVFVLLSFALLFPTMLNETKGSLVLLPIAFLAPLLATPGIERLGIKLMFAGTTFVLLAIGYSTVNRILIGNRDNYFFLDLFLDPDRLIGYLIPSGMGGSWMGRGDKLLLAWENISDSVVTTLLGVGMGNVNDTSHDLFAGEFNEFGSLLGTTFNQYLWETGVIGVLLAVLLPVLSFFDARRVARKADNIANVFANGWVAVAPIMFISVFYIRAPDAQALSYLFFFFSGYLAACAQRIRVLEAGPENDKTSRFVPITSTLVAQHSRVTG